MIVTPLQLDSYPQCILGPASDTGRERSTGKPHLTDILRDMARVAGISKDDASFSSDDMNWYAAGGWLWERVFDMAHADAIQRGELANIGEIEMDNIVGTPDRIDFSVPKVVELKCRWASARKFEQLERYWWIEIAQIKSYCWMLQMTEADLIVFHINGNWRPPTPRVSAANLRFSERELEENWLAVLGHARSMGVMV